MNAKYEISLGHILTLSIAILGGFIVSWTQINSRISVLETNVYNMENITTKEIQYIREDLKDIKTNLSELLKRQSK
jgi:5-bromo-4-chloroindolyl phosphate hydrolysis protein